MISIILLEISTLTPTVAHSKFLRATSTFLCLLLLLLLLVFPNRFCILIDCLAYSIVASVPPHCPFPQPTFYLCISCSRHSPALSSGLAHTHTHIESRVCRAYEACDCFTYSLLITWRRCWGLSPSPLLYSLSFSAALTGFNCIIS